MAWFSFEFFNQFVVLLNNLDIMADWDTPAVLNDQPEVKLFGKWSTSDVSVSDISVNVSHLLNIFGFYV